MLPPDPTELSSNRSTILHTGRQCANPPDRHPDLCFSDGNVVILTGNVYFVVHKGPLGRHSPVLERLLQDLPTEDTDVIDGLPVLAVPYTPEEMVYFLRTLYGCVRHMISLSSLSQRCFSFPVDMVNQDFCVTSALLKLATAYEVDNLRAEIIQRFTQCWPKSLSQWEIREKSAVNEDGVYAPRPKLPHPM